MKIFWTIVVLVIVIGGGWYFYSSSNSFETLPGDDSGVSLKVPVPGTETPEMVVGGGKEFLVEMNASGFSPPAFTIKAWDTVKFVNKDARDRWPASGMHPTHQLCPGFDSLKPMKTGEEYSFTFTEKKECPMHDHLIPSLRGKITVE